MAAMTQTLAPWGRGGGRRLPGPLPPPRPGPLPVQIRLLPTVARSPGQSAWPYEVPMGGGAFFRVSGRSSLKSQWTYVPGGAGGRRA